MGDCRFQGRASSVVRLSENGEEGDAVCFRYDRYDHMSQSWTEQGGRGSYDLAPGLLTAELEGARSLRSDSSASGSD